MNEGNFESLFRIHLNLKNNTSCVFNVNVYIRQMFGRHLLVFEKDIVTYHFGNIVQLCFFFKGNIFRQCITGTGF